MIRNRSVRFYLTLSYALFLFVVLSAVHLIWFEQQEAAAEAAVRARLEHNARELGAFSDFEGDTISLPAYYTAYGNSVRVVFLSLDREARSLSPHELTPYQQDIVYEIGSEALAGNTVSREIYSRGHGETLYSAAPVYDEEGILKGAICLFLSIDDFESWLVQVRRKSLLLIALVALLSTPLGMVLATLLTSRITGARNLAGQVASGDYHARLPESGPQELADLSRHLNNMAEQLQQQRNTREMVLANLTHELARPLGGLRLGVESLRSGAVDNHDLADDLLNEMGKTIQHMEALLEDLSLAARPEGSPLQLEFSPVPLNPLLHGIKSRYWPRAESQGIKLLVCWPDDDLMIEADELRLYQILTNLIDNAMKFTPAGGSIVVSAKGLGDEVDLTICDNGPGIPQTELSNMFTPFTQGKHTDQIHQGMGLGLSIVNQLVLAHGGNIDLSNLPEGGLQARITLPVTQANR